VRLNNFLQLDHDELFEEMINISFQMLIDKLMTVKNLMLNNYPMVLIVDEDIDINQVYNIQI
jgi:hypothetical protein